MLANMKGNFSDVGQLKRLARWIRWSLTDHPEIIARDPSGRMVYDANRDTVMGHEFVGEVIAHGPDCAGRFPAGGSVSLQQEQHGR
jgi:hypothetical protein